MSFLLKQFYCVISSLLCDFLHVRVKLQDKKVSQNSLNNMDIMKIITVSSIKVISARRHASFNLTSLNPLY